MSQRDEAKELKVDEGKGKALEVAVSQIEKQFGQGAIMRLGAGAAKVSVPTISTGALTLDIALGIGGVPRGRIIEIFGPESSGKTTLAVTIAANAQKAGGTAAIIDAEHAFDASYAQKIGVDLDSLLISQPDCGEDALNIAEVLVRSIAVAVVVLASVAALVPKAEIEGEMGDSQVEDVLYLHQPDPRENRRDVRQPGDDARRQGSQVLLLDPARPPEGRELQEQPGRHHGEPRPGEGGEE